MNTLANMEMRLFKLCCYDKKAFVLFKVESHQDEINNNDLAYERHFREATHDIAQVQSTILRNKLIQDVANIFNMSPEMIYHEVGSNNMPQVAPAEYGYSPQSGSQLFNNLTKHEKAERALLKHFMKDKDTFINYYQKLAMKTLQINILRVYLIFCMTIFQNMIIIVSVMLCNTLIPMSLERHLLNLNNIPSMMNLMRMK